MIKEGELCFGFLDLYRNKLFITHYFTRCLIIFHCKIRKRKKCISKIRDNLKIKVTFDCEIN